ncbi:hypothetical protein PspLS_06374 [Pyricularia sp. CBS 133598]|nr:hypothetical protein PspLS_06374 [Pyricularia sp. CBS 133598]
MFILQSKATLLAITLVISQVYGAVQKCTLYLWQGKHLVDSTYGDVCDAKWLITLEGQKIGLVIEPECGYELEPHFQKIPPGYEIKGGWELYDTDNEDSDSDDEGYGTYCWNTLGTAVSKYALSKVRNLYIGQVEYQKDP